jgi:hypothetical protein
MCPSAFSSRRPYGLQVNLGTPITTKPQIWFAAILIGGELFGEVAGKSNDQNMFSLDGGNTATNPVRENFKRLITLPGDDSRARNCLRHMENLAADLDREFPDRYSATKKTIAADILWMKKAMLKK